MAVVVTKEPALIQACFNPMILEVTGLSDDEVIDVLVRPEGEGATELQKEVFNGILVSDLSPFLKNEFKDKITPIADNNLYIDSNLVLLYDYAFLSIPYIERYALNAVFQVGESPDFATKRGTFLTEFHRLKYYDNFPMDISVLSHDEGSYVNFDGQRVSQLPIYNIHFTIPVQPNKGYIGLESRNNVPNEGVKLITNAEEIITDNQGNIIYIKLPGTGSEERRLPIANMCTPKNPFWARWINRTAGWDYWMFSKRQYIERGIENQESFYPNIYDIENAKGTTEILKEDGYENITVGADMLNKNEYDNISKIVYSPKIQYYNTVLGKWIQLIKDDVSVTNDTYAESNSIELTFSMPKIQMQY